MSAPPNNCGGFEQTNQASGQTVVMGEVPYARELFMDGQEDIAEQCCAALELLKEKLSVSFCGAVNTPGMLDYLSNRICEAYECDRIRSNVLIASKRKELIERAKRQKAAVDT